MMRSCVRTFAVTAARARESRPSRGSPRGTRIRARRHRCATGAWCAVRMHRTAAHLALSIMSTMQELWIMGNVVDNVLRGYGAQGKH
jgi:hypothetical protein